MTRMDDLPLAAGDTVTLIVDTQRADGRVVATLPHAAWIALGPSAAIPNRGDRVELQLIGNDALYGIRGHVKSVETDGRVQIAWGANRIQRVQRRAFFRVRARLDVHVEVPSTGESTTLFTFDLSAGGLLVAAPVAWPVGAEVTLSLTLPDDEPPLDVRGRILRRQRVEGASGMAIEFIDLDEANRARLTRVLFRLQART